LLGPGTRIFVKRRRKMEEMKILRGKTSVRVGLLRGKPYHNAKHRQDEMIVCLKENGGVIFKQKGPQRDNNG